MLSQPDLNPREIEALKLDLANRIHEADTIAKRYGLEDIAGLQAYLSVNPWIVNEATRMRTLIDSDQGTPSRIEIKSQITYEDVALPALAGIVADDNKPTRDRIDAAKLIKDSGKLGVRAADQVSQGTSLNLTINLPGRTERITTVVDASPNLPPPDDDE